MVKKSKLTGLTRADVEVYFKIKIQTEQLLNDVSELSKKHPDGAISKFKLKFVNEKLYEANKFLLPPYKPIEDFEVFDDSTLPSNSDVLMVLAQYLKCLELWRSSKLKRVKDTYGSHWEWKLDDDSISTTKPSTDAKFDEEEE